MIAAKTLRLDVGGQTYRYPSGPSLPGYRVWVYPLQNGDNLFVANMGGQDCTKPPPNPPVLGQPAHLGPHTVTLEDASGNPLKSWTNANHWYNSEAEYWVDDPALVMGRFKIVRSPQKMVDDGLTFPIGLPPGEKTLGKPTRVPFAGPMSTSWMTIYEPTTGSRPTIGLMNGGSAIYMQSGDPLQMLDIALASASWPLHVVDTNTGKSPDLVKYPRANSYSTPSQGQPWILRGPYTAPASPTGSAEYTFGGGLTPQQAHHVEEAGVAFFATMDPGFLRRCQFSAKYLTCVDASRSAQAGVATFWGETRGLAWTIRDLTNAIRATQLAESLGWDLVAMGLEPSSVFVGLFNNGLANLAKDMNNPALAVFHLVGVVNRYAPWEISFLIWAFGLALQQCVGALCPLLEPLFLHLFGQPIQRLVGPPDSDFPVAYTGYWLALHPNSDGSKPFFTNYSQIFDDLFHTTDTSLKNSGFTQAVYDALKADPFNGGTILFGSGNDYRSADRAAFAIGDILDKGVLAGKLRAKYPKFDVCLARAEQFCAQVNPTIAVNYAFVHGAFTAPPVVIPPPPLPQPTPVPVPIPAPTPTPPTAQQKLDTLAIDIKAALAKAGY